MNQFLLLTRGPDWLQSSAASVASGSTDRRPRRIKRCGYTVSEQAARAFTSVLIAVNGI